VKKKELFPLVTIGFMVNNFFPARIGEAVRALLLWKRNRFTIAESVGSLLVERFLDVWVFASFVCIPIFVLPQLSTLRGYAVFIAAGLTAVLVLFALYAWKNAFVKKIVNCIAQKAPVKIRAFLITTGKEVVSNLEWLFSFKRAVPVAIL
jgi:uncharacterized protein (TIRG00374 family)